MFLTNLYYLQNTGVLRLDLFIMKRPSEGCQISQIKIQDELSELFLITAHKSIIISKLKI